MFDFYVSEITAADMCFLMEDVDEVTGMSTIEMGIRSGLDIDWDEELGMTVSGGDERHMMAFIAMCFAALGDEDMLAVAMTLLADEE